MIRTLADWLKDAEAQLQAAGVESPRLDAQLIAAHVLNSLALPFSRDQIRLGGAVLERHLTVPQCECLDQHLARRKNREPVAKIIGKKEFWSLEFSVSRDCLDPRPESETLVEACLKLIADHRLDHILPPESRMICDLGTGSGCLLLALLSELPHWRGIGIDQSAAAIDIARQNGESLAMADRCQFEVGDWGDCPIPAAAIYISNPPYIAFVERQTLAPELAFEPPQALFADDHGLAAYKVIIPRLAQEFGKFVQRINDQGLFPWVVFEVGVSPKEGQQAAAVKRILTECGFNVVNIKYDLHHLPRVVVAEWQGGTI